MNSSNELEFLLDLPNESNLSIRSHKGVHLSASMSNPLTDNNLDSPFSSLKIKTRKEENERNGSEMYFKILKNVKTATKTLLEENKSKLPSNNQNLLEKIEKIKTSPLLPKRIEEIPPKEEKPQQTLKRKFTEAFDSSSCIPSTNTFSFPPAKKFKSITIDNFFKK